MAPFLVFAVRKRHYEVHNKYNQNEEEMGATHRAEQTLFCNSDRQQNHKSLGKQLIKAPVHGWYSASTAGDSFEMKLLISSNQSITCHGKFWRAYSTSSNAEGNKAPWRMRNTSFSWQTTKTAVYTDSAMQIKRQKSSFAPWRSCQI